ncbi:wd repeat protein [Diplodia corticola]|uniref:Wd repeat protein n=1 Tax=Diplodia corticola TaxID=236234 RepID=A0A1J9RS05_9PEZI|nr:wd repeat protein [Diplodia corticola]OJD30309.1 wd repeat protein [Diplodia corticola]
MKVTNHSDVPVYTVSGSDTARPLPDWLARKRKRSLKQDAQYAHRIELLQDFEFEEASQCVRVSEDGDWLMSTGTYKPQIHTHYLPHLSLSYARHTNTINQTFLLLSEDYTKSLHLQTDRFLEFHNPGGLHYTTRIPRYGRDLKYDRRSTEALVPAVGVNEDGMGEVFRLNLELGRFMKAFEIDVGGDDYTSMGGGALQGGINTGSVNVAAIAEESHNLLGFGTSLGTVEFWDPRSRSRVGILSLPPNASYGDEKVGITALEFDRSGLSLASGTSNGLVHLYDLRSPVPLLKKDQGFGLPIQDIIFLQFKTRSAQQTSEPKILTSDKRIIKIWDQRDGKPWTHVEPAVDMHHVEWVKDSGMLLTANEGKQQHAFFIPQLGPAPKWSAFLDNVVEEMAEDPDDPNAFGGHKVGEVYDNYKFLTMKELEQLNMAHLVGTTSLLRPYMHGYFVAQKLYEEARLISQPELWQEQRAKSIQERINKERESRIRGNKKVQVKVNRRLAEKMLEREEKNERRKARRVLERGGDDDDENAVQAPSKPVDEDAEVVDDDHDETAAPDNKPAGARLLTDSRFAKLFQDEDFEVDEGSREFQSINPSTNSTKKPQGLTAVEQEALDDRRHGASSDDSSDEDDDDDDSDVAEQPAKRRNAAPPAQQDKEKNAGRISSSSYKKSGHRPMPQMVVSSSKKDKNKFSNNRDKSFGARAANLKDNSHNKRRDGGSGGGAVVGEKEVTFAPKGREKPQPRRQADEGEDGRTRKRMDNRRSASGNTFRKM